MTWSNAADVLVTGKVDESTGQPHLRVYTQDRDDFTQASSAASVTGTGTAEHSVPHLSRDSVLPAQHLSWTAKVPGGDDDLKTKVKDGSTWSGSTLRTIPTSGSTSDTEDHSEIDFTYSGRRYTVYHRDQSGSNPDIAISGAVAFLPHVSATFDAPRARRARGQRSRRERRGREGARDEGALDGVRALSSGPRGERNGERFTAEPVFGGRSR
jgi:hypothetical protein